MWMNKATIHCTVHHTEEVISIYQVARWGPLQFANIWQVHTLPVELLAFTRHAIALGFAQRATLDMSQLDLIALVLMHAA